MCYSLGGWSLGVSMHGAGVNEDEFIKHHVTGLKTCLDDLTLKIRTSNE